MLAGHKHSQSSKADKQWYATTVSLLTNVFGKFRKSNPALEYLRSQPQSQTITTLIQVLSPLTAELVLDAKKYSHALAPGKHRLVPCVFDLELVGGFSKIMEFAQRREIASAFADSLIFEAFGKSPSAVPTDEEFRFLGTEKYRGIAKYALAQKYFSMADTDAHLFGKEYSKVVSGDAMDFAYIASSRPMTLSIRKWGAWTIEHSLTGRSPSKEEIDSLKAAEDRAYQALDALLQSASERQADEIH